jgi:RND family efflux transporter MFP subunit
MRPKRWPAIAPLLLALALAACGGGAEAGGGDNGSTYTVVRGPLRITLTEKGTLRAKNSVKIRSTAKNPAKVVQLIEEGTTVKEGDLLVELDKANLEKEVDSLRDQVDQLTADVKNAQNDYDIQVSDNKSNIEKAQLALDLAERDLERYEQGDRIQDERAKKLRVETAETDLERAKEKAKETPELLKEGFLTAFEAEEEAQRIYKLETELETAKLDLKLWREYSDPMELKRRKSKVEESKRELERALKLSESRLANKDVVRRQKKRRLEKAEQKYVEAEEQLNHMEIRAPAPGIVVFEQGRRWDSEQIKIGDTAYPRQTLMTLPDLSEMKVELEIHEADITKLKKGLSAVVTLQSYRSLVLTGEIVRIATVGTSRGRWDSTKKFQVTVDIKERDLNLRPGISAEVEVLIEEIPDTISVPIQAIFASGGDLYCWVLEDGEPKRCDIQTSERSNDNFVEVVEGLDVGDEILLYDPEQQEESSEEEGNGEEG